MKSLMCEWALVTITSFCSFMANMHSSVHDTSCRSQHCHSWFLQYQWHTGRYNTHLLESAAGTSYCDLPSTATTRSSTRARMAQLWTAMTTSQLHLSPSETLTITRISLPFWNIGCYSSLYSPLLFHLLHTTRYRGTEMQAVQTSYKTKYAAYLHLMYTCILEQWHSNFTIDSQGKHSPVRNTQLVLYPYNSEVQQPLWQSWGQWCWHSGWRGFSHIFSQAKHSSPAYSQQRTNQPTNIKSRTTCSFHIRSTSDSMATP